MSAPKSFGSEVEIAQNQCECRHPRAQNLCSTEPVLVMTHCLVCWKWSWLIALIDRKLGLYVEVQGETLCVSCHRSLTSHVTYRHRTGEQINVIRQCWRREVRFSFTPCPANV